MKRTILLLGSFTALFYTSDLQAQEKRKVDLQVEILSPVADSLYADGKEIPFKARLINKGPSDLKYGDTLIYWSSITELSLDVLMKDLPVGAEYVMYDSYISTSGPAGEIGELELCVSALWDNELAGPPGDTTAFSSSWIDEIQGNNETCSVFRVGTETTTLQNASQENNFISVYPIPAKNELNVYIQDHYSGEYKMAVYSIDGKEIHNQTITKNTNNDIMKVDVRHLTPGIYYLQMKHTKNTYTTKFIIQ